MKVRKEGRWKDMEEREGFRGKNFMCSFEGAGGRRAGKSRIENKTGKRGQVTVLFCYIRVSVRRYFIRKQELCCLSNTPQSDNQAK